ncbi:MAG: FkbM family methyltransferase [Roseovarius sp.]|nr:FkbM family methyltransferase [Roseovarius sp.]
MYQSYIDACGKDGQKIERLIRSFYSAQSRRSVFIDGGAHTGYHSLYAAHRFDTRVVGIEASPNIYINLIKKLRETPQRGGCEVQLVNSALGCRARQGDTAQFFYSPTHPGRSTVNTKMWEQWGKGAVEYNAPILAPIIEIDDLRALYTNGKPVDFIKLDLEGAEINALRGGVRTLMSDRPNIVMEFGLKPTNEQLFGETLAGFREMLSDWGYRAYAPWGEEVTESMLEGYPFWYLFLLPDDAEHWHNVSLLDAAFQKSVLE